MHRRKQSYNTSEELERLEDSIAVLDLETDPFKEGRLEINPFCAGFYDGKSLEIFWGKDCCVRLVALLMKCKPGTIVYAHNGGNFDFHFLLEFLPVADCKFLCMGKRIVQIKIPVGVVTVAGKEIMLFIELRDSYAIVPKKLASFGKTKIDYAKFEKHCREQHRKEIVAYLKDDLRNNRAMIFAFLKRYPLKLTLASSVFKLMEDEYDYAPGRSDEGYDSKFRPFFFGGRVQFWELGALQGKFTIVDINSAYPAGMCANHWFEFESETSSKMPSKHREQSLFIIECFSKGVFPLRAKDGSVHYPTGCNRFYVTGWELLNAQKCKLCSDVEIMMCFSPHRVKSMRAFAETLYDRKNTAKKDGDKEEEYASKIGLNAGYGRLALNAKKYSEVKVSTLYDKPARWDNKEDKQTNPNKPDWELCWHDKDRELSFWKRSSYKEGIDKFINVATAASITGNVRAFLSCSMQRCERVVYCDTDSIIAGNTSNLKKSDKLGEWKDELFIDTSKVYEYTDDNGKKQKHQSGLWIAGKKLYAAFGLDVDGKPKWKTASKGVSLTAKKIIDLANGKYVTKTFDAPTYSLHSKPKFVTREVRRADMPKRKKVVAKKKNNTQIIFAANVAATV